MTAKRCYNYGTKSSKLVICKMIANMKKSGGSSRLELATQLAMSAPNVGRYITYMRNNGLMHKAVKQESRIGESALYRAGADGALRSLGSTNDGAPHMVSAARRDPLVAALFGAGVRLQIRMSLFI